MNDAVAKALTDVLVSHDGPTGLSNNICDALFAVARGIQRAAVAIEDQKEAIDSIANNIESVAGQLEGVATELKGIGQELGPGNFRSFGQTVDGVAAAIDRLGTADAATPMGALEHVAKEIRDGLGDLANAIREMKGE